MKNILRVSLIIVFSFALAVGVGILKIFTPYETNKAVNVASIVLGIIAIIGIFASMLAQAILNLKLKKKLENLDIQKTANEIVENRKNAKDYLLKTQKDLKKIINQVIIYAIILLILAQIVAFAFTVHFTTTGLFVFWLNFACLSAIFYKKTEYELSLCKTKAEYPLYYELVEKARANSTYKGKAYFTFTEDSNVTVSTFERYCVLELGIGYVSVLHKEELYQVLLHEFEHIGENETFSPKMYSRNTYFENANFPFTYLAALYCINFSLGQLVTSLLNEEIADGIINSKGDTKHTAKALTKSAYLSNFYFETNKYTKPVWLYEDPCDTYWLDYVESFKKACAERSDFWNELIKKEIQPLMTTHPITRKRLEAIGEDIQPIDFPTKEDAFYLESLKALNEIDKHSEALCYYEEAREDYLSALKIIEDWQNNGSKFNEDNFIDLITKLDNFLLYDEAEALCDKALENSSSKLILSCANFHKGLYLLYRYDKSGLEFLYKCIELEPEQFNNCIHIIGEFCCKMGLEQELLASREMRDNKVNEMFRYHQEVNRIEKDTLFEFNFSKEFIDELNKFCVSFDENQIVKIYGAKRTLHENQQLVFYLTFNKASMQKIEDICSKFYNFACANSQINNFNIHIFVMQPTIENVFKKIPNSLLYKSK